MQRTIAATPTETSLLSAAFQAYQAAQAELTKLFTMFAESHGVPQADLVSIASDGKVVVKVKESAKPVRPPVNPAVRNRTKGTKKRQ